jgi:hypothetical protein
MALPRRDTPKKMKKKNLYVVTLTLDRITIYSRKGFQVIKRVGQTFRVYGERDRGLFYKDWSERPSLDGFPDIK